MSILHASALAFLSIIPLILILYFMKQRRQEKLISNHFLWKKSIEDAKVDSFFQKLRTNILLFLQILFIILAVMALARPYINAMKRLPKKIIIILDSSASMQVLEGRKSRFDIAREKIRQLVDGAGEGTSFAMISETKRAELLSGFTTDRQIINNILRNLSPKDTGTDLQLSFALADSLIKSNQNAEIFLFSDGGGNIEKCFSKSESVIHFESIGKSNYNVGFTAFDIKETRKSGHYQVFLTLSNFSESRIKTIMQLNISGRLIEARETSLSPEEQKSFIFEINSTNSGLLEASIDTDDDLIIDNNVWAIIPKKEAEKTFLLVGSENPFIEKLISIMPSVKLRKFSNHPDKSELKKASLIIWENMNLERIPEGNHIFFNCRLPQDILTSNGIVKFPLPLSWDKTHRINRFVDYSNLTISEAQKNSSPVWGKTLLKSGENDLIVLLEKDKIFNAVVFSFDPFKSDLFLSPVFPILMNNIADYFVKTNGLSMRNLFRPEEKIKISDPGGFSKLTVIYPGGKKETKAFNLADASSVDSKRTGIYTLSGTDKQFSFAINLLDEKESSIKPLNRNFRKSIPGRTKKAESSPLIIEFSRPFAFMALLVLLLEWICFHRRRQ